MRKITRHIIHCSDTPDDREVSVDEIREWHVAGNGWADIGYHFLIHRDGTLSVGRPVERAGSHCKGFNADSIGTCLIGREEFTEAQFKQLRRLHKSIVSSYEDITVHGHREFSATKTCPNFEVSEVI